MDELQNSKYNDRRMTHLQDGARNALYLARKKKLVIIRKLNISV